MIKIFILFLFSVMPATWEKQANISFLFTPSVVPLAPPRHPLAISTSSPFPRGDVVSGFSPPRGRRKSNGNINDVCERAWVIRWAIVKNVTFLVKATGRLAFAKRIIHRSLIFRCYGDLCNTTPRKQRIMQL